MIFGIYLQNHIQNLQIGLSQILKKKGYKTYLYTNNKLHKKYINREIKNIFEDVKYNDILDFIYRTKNKSNKSKQKFYEKKMQMTYLDFIASNRVLGIEYAIGSEYHPSHELSKIDKKKIFCGLNDFFDFWVKEVKEKKIKVLISGEKDHWAVSKICNIQFRGIERARYKNYHYWTKNQFKQIDNIKKSYIYFSKKNKKKYPKSSLIKRAYDAEFLRRDRNLKSLKFFKIIFKILQTFKKYILVKIKGGKYSYNLISSIRSILLRVFHYRYLKKNSYSLKEIKKFKQKIIFFPLHTEPEPQILNNSPFFFFQEALIALVSRYLPSNYLLVVKESIVGIGRRNLNFYKKIKKFKNVVFIDPVEDGVNVIKNSDCVVTIAGTAGLEASILGIPVLSLSKHNDYNLLPHVFYLNDLSKIKIFFNKFLMLNSKKIKAKIDGYNYLCALKRSTFSMSKYNHLQTNKINPVNNEIKKILFNSLISTFKKL